MYDNIDLTLYKTDFPNCNFLNVIPQYLTSIFSHGESQFGHYINGALGGLKIKITENSVKILDSSLCKYYLGNNFKTLGKSDTKHAIVQISDLLHLPFNLANVTRIDVAQNLIMQHPEKLYYPYLGESQHYNRLEQNNGLYYNNNLRQKLFYGKEHEQKIKKQVIPELYKNRHTLRFELRFRNRLREQFNLPKITADLLYNESFYSELVKRWKKEYLNINKNGLPFTSIPPTGSKKDLLNALAHYALNNIGQPQVLKQIIEWQTLGIITKKQAYDLRATIKKISQNSYSNEGNQLINELDKKIKYTARFA